MRIVFIVIFLLSSIFAFMIFAFEQANLVNPYPGGSPFPPGGEPSLTHIVKVYWTTLDGMGTHIIVKVGGSRPTQMDCTKIEEKGEKTINRTIAPDCDYDFLFTTDEHKKLEGVRAFNEKGQGTMTVKVFGFKLEDFSTPPKVVVKYYKGEQIVGETIVEAQPIPDKFKKKE